MAYLFSTVCSADAVHFGRTVIEWEEIRLREVGLSETDIYRRLPWSAQEFWERFSARTLFSLMSENEPTLCLAGLLTEFYDFQRGEINSLERISVLDSFQLEDLIDLFLSKSPKAVSVDLHLVPIVDQPSVMLKALVEVGRSYVPESEFREIWSEKNVRSRFIYAIYDQDIDDVTVTCYRLEGGEFFSSLAGFTVLTSEGTPLQRAKQIVEVFEAWWLLKKRSLIAKEIIDDVILAISPESEVINYGDDVKVLFPKKLLESSVSLIGISSTCPPSPPLRALLTQSLKKGFQTKKWFSPPDLLLLSLSLHERMEWQKKHFYHGDKMWDRLLLDGMMVPECKPSPVLSWWYLLPRCFAPFRYYSNRQYDLVQKELVLCVPGDCFDVIPIIFGFMSAQMARFDKPTVECNLPLEKSLTVKELDRPSTPECLTSSIIPKGLGHSAIEWNKARELTVGLFPFLLYQQRKQCLYYREGVLLAGQSTTIVVPRTGVRVIISTLLPTELHQDYCSLNGRPFIKVGGVNACPEVPLADVFVPSGSESWILPAVHDVYRTLYWITVIHERTGQWATRPVIFVSSVWNGCIAGFFPDVTERLDQLSLTYEQSSICAVQAHPLRYVFSNGVEIGASWLVASYGMMELNEETSEDEAQEAYDTNMNMN